VPWKKNFDIEEAVEKAMIVFWEKGYEATSIVDLTEATGVQRQSLYNAFGGKQEFFIRALEKFIAERQRAVLVDHEARGKPLESINSLFDDAVEGAGKRGCFLVNTALELQSHGEEVRKLVSAASKAFRNSFVKLITQGQELGEIPASIEPREAASGLLAGLYGIRVMGRGAVGKRVQRLAANQTLRLVA